MKGRHLHFDIAHTNHTERDNKDLCFLVVEGLVVELQHKFFLFSIDCWRALFGFRSLTWNSTADCERISRKAIVACTNWTVIVHSTHGISTASTGRARVDTFLVQTSLIERTL